MDPSDDQPEDRMLPRVVIPGAALSKAMRGIAEVTQQVGSVMVGLRSVAAGWQQAIAPLFQMARQWDQALEHIRAMPRLMEERLRTLVHRGWFIDPDMSFPDIRSLHEAFTEGREEEAEAWLVAYYRANGGAIVERLCEQHPQRAALMREAFHAHLAGQYALSVPVFLLQADGLAYDLKSGRQLFSKRDDKGVRGLLKELPEGSMDRVFLTVYAEDSALVRNTRLLPEGFDGLNRHGVLHGTDLRYATEANSLRALSVLTYAAFALASTDA